MFVIRLKDRNNRVANPTWERIESAIRGLDGDDLFLKGTDDSSMIVGGQNGRYFAQITLNGSDFHTLLGKTKSKKQVPLVVGNQEINLESYKISNLDDVLKAANTFALDGKVDEGLRWKLL